MKNARELKAFLIDADGNVRVDNLQQFNESCEAGRTGLSRFSIRDLNESFRGERWHEQNTVSLREGNLREAGGMPVSSTMLPQIVGQLLFSEVRKQFDVESNVFGPLVPVIQSMIKGTEIVPSITNVSPSDVEDVHEGQSYPRIGVSEEYFTLPAKTKKGAIIELTREAIKFDKTSMLVEQARSIGSALGAARENAIIDCLIGQTNNYIRNGTATNTYLTAGAYINNQSSTPLVDWTDVDSALQLFAAILDPTTSEPLAGVMNPPHLVVMPFKVKTAQRILTATSTVSDQRPSLGSGVVSDRTDAPSPIASMGLQLVSSNRLYRRVLAGPEPTAATAQEGWFLGDISKLLGWYEVWPLQLMQKGPESEASWDRDIELQYKASYYGVCAVREPRYMLRMESTAW